jgi:hypothetical protein
MFRYEREIRAKSSIRFIGGKRRGKADYFSKHICLEREAKSDEYSK